MCRSQSKTRELYLDAIKVFALLMVFLLHTQRGVEVTDPCHNFVLFYLGRCAMPLFFMVNGTLILSKETFTFEYYKKKVSKIIRLLFLWGCVTIGYYLIVMRTGIFEAVKNGLKVMLAYHWVINLWFFITFILIYTLLLFCFDWVKTHITQCVVVLFVVCVVIESISVVNIFHGGFFIQEFINQRLRLWTWCFYFCLGFLLKSMTFKKLDKGILAFSTVVFTVVSIVWQYYLCWFKTEQIESNYMHDDLLIIVWSIGIFLCFRYFEVLWKLSVFANISFGAFLMHSYFIDAWNLRALPHNGLESIGVVVLLTAGTFVLSYYLNKIPVVKKLFQY